MKRLIIVFGMLLMLCSCAVEPNDVAYIVALGFDKGENENYQVTLQFAKPNKISGGSSEEGGSTGSEIVENITVEAPNMYSAINIANNIVSKTFSLSHTKLVVFSEEIAKEGLSQIVSTMIRSDDLRPDVFVAVARESSKDYLDSVNPLIEVNPAKYYQLIFHDSKSFGVPRTNLQRFYFNEKLKNRNSVLPLVGTNDIKSEESSAGGSKQDSSESENSKGNEPQNKKSKESKINDGKFEYKIKNYKAGEVVINGKIKSEAMGMVLFDGDRAVGEFGSVECEIYNLLWGNIGKGYISFANSLSNEPVTVKLTKNKSPKYKVDRKNKKIRVELFLESDLYSIPSEFDSDEDIDKFEESAKSDIETSCHDFIVNMRDIYSADVIGFGFELKKSFLTNKAFNEYDFMADYKNYDIEVDVDFKIRRTGMKYE